MTGRSRPTATSSTGPAPSERAGRPESEGLEAVRVDVVSPDPRSLRGLAHPLRLQLLGMLRADGPATASRLAARTGQSSGATSYHLRQLAAYGFVVEDTGLGNGRDRWWRAAHRATRFELPPDADEEARAVGEEYLRVVANAHARRVESAIAGLATVEADLGVGWSEILRLSDVQLRLTAGEAHELLAELRAVAARYRADDPESVDQAPEDARRVLLQLQVLPVASGGLADA